MIRAISFAQLTLTRPFWFSIKAYGRFIAGNLIPMYVPVMVWQLSHVFDLRFRSIHIQGGAFSNDIGDRLRTLGDQKKLSQGDIEHRCGLLRCYISRVENGHTIPSIETLERMARPSEVPFYLLEE